MNIACARDRAMDSAGVGRYPLGMRFLRLLLLLAAAAAGTPARAAEAPVLAVLEYPDGLFSKHAEIRAQPGIATSPLADKPQLLWTLREGDSLRQENSPPDRAIRILQVVDNNPLLVCMIVVHYSPGEKGWRPGYMLLQQPPVTWNGEQWVPLANAQGMRGRLKIVTSSAPEAGGYVRSLSFGLGTELLRVDAWEVQ